MGYGTLIEVLRSLISRLLTDSFIFLYLFMQNYNLTDYYNIDVFSRMDADPLFVSSSDYYLQSKAGHYTEKGYVLDYENSPCIFPDYELGAYCGTSQASIYCYPPKPSVVIPRASESDLKAFVQALRDGGYLEEGDEIRFENVSDDFRVT